MVAKNFFSEKRLFFSEMPDLF